MRYSVPIVIAFFRSEGLALPEMEYAFAKARKFRFDMAWPKERVALEVEGGIWTRGAHGRGSGIKRDMEKYNLAACLGWRVLRVTPDEVAMLSTIHMLKDALTNYQVVETRKDGLCR